MAVCLLAGCSGDRLKTYTVNGTVRFEDGDPVRTGAIELISVQHNIQARGTIQSDGSFTLTTYRPSDGAVAGEHKVIVRQIILTEDLALHLHDHGGTIHPRYGNYDTSGLRVTIETRDLQQIDLVVQPIP